MANDYLIGFLAQLGYNFAIAHIDLKYKEKT